MIYDMRQTLLYSHGAQQRTDLATIQALIAGCTGVVKTDLAQDRQGVDYLATLRGGAQLRIDAKTRQAGASRYWRHGPEVALEKWSVMPGGKFNTPASAQRTGWTLNEQKITELVLFTFDPSDTSDVYLMPFQPLRMAFRHYLPLWYGPDDIAPGHYKRDMQTTHWHGTHWQSSCVFVPVDVVWAAIRDVCKGEAVVPVTPQAQLAMPWAHS